MASCIKIRHVSPSVFNAGQERQALRREYNNGGPQKGPISSFVGAGTQLYWLGLEHISAPPSTVHGVMA